MSSLYRGLIIPSGTDRPDAPKAFRDYADSGPVPRFVDPAARDAAIPDPVEGQLVYVQSAGIFMWWDGTGWATQQQANQASFPVGSLIMFAGAAAPADWKLCDGSSLLSTDFPELFAIIGNTYGGTAPNFLLPDFRGRSPIGVGSTTPSQGNSYALGLQWGSEAMPAHSHGGTTVGADRAQAHVHAGWGNEGYMTPNGPASGIGAILQQGGRLNNRPSTDWTNTDHLHNFNTAAAGAGGHQNVHPVLGVNMIIKAA
jgi:microcystin-dependent protein